MLKHISGEVNIDPFIAPASTAFTFNDVVTRDSAGKLALATQATPRSEILGLIQQEIAAADSDYADDKVVMVLRPDEDAEFEADVSTGTLVQAMVGKRYDLDDEDSIDVTSQLQKSVEIKRVLSTSKAIVKFVVDGERFRLVSYQQTVTYDEFTAAGAVGTLALGCTIPAGAVFARALITGITGFTGDTSAAITVGTSGGDVDRYNTGTPSVFTTAAAGCDLGAPSGTLWHTAAVVPDLIVTSNAAYSSVSAGQLTITLFWYEAD